MPSTPVHRRFSAVVVMVRGAGPKPINPCVRVPTAVVAALRAESGKSQALPVRGTLQGKPFKANVVRYLGAWRLYLNGVMRKRAGVGPGDRVSVVLRHDPLPRREKVPPAFAKALAGDVRAQATFKALPPSRRKELLRYLNSLKREESLKRNIAKMMRYLKGLKTGASPKGLYRAE